MKDKRTGHKKARQAERQVLSGGHVHTVRGSGRSGHVPQPTLTDEESVRFPKKKARRRPKKEKKWCPARENERHEYLEDKRKEMSRRYLWNPTTHQSDSQLVTGTIRYKLCVHCGKELIFDPRPPRFRRGRRWISVDEPVYWRRYFIDETTGS